MTGVRQNSATLLAVGVCLALALAACRTGVPVIDANDGPATALGTITGTVSGPDGETAIAGRPVHAINLDTGARESGVTSTTGGYTFKLPPGRYRVEVDLLAGETLVEDEGPFTLSRSELQHDVDLRIGTRRQPEAVRIYQPPLPTGAPIA